MGMSSTEWSRYLHEELGLAETPEELNRIVVERMEERYRRQLPLVDGAVEAVRGLADRWPLGLASSSNRPLIHSRSTSWASPSFARPRRLRRSTGGNRRRTSTSRRRGG